MRVKRGIKNVRGRLWLKAEGVGGEFSVLPSSGRLYKSFGGCCSVPDTRELAPATTATKTTTPAVP